MVFLLPSVLTVMVITLYLDFSSCRCTRCIVTFSRRRSESCSVEHLLISGLNVFDEDKKKKFSPEENRFVFPSENLPQNQDVHVKRFGCTTLRLNVHPHTDHINIPENKDVKEQKTNTTFYIRCPRRMRSCD